MRATRGCPKARCVFVPPTTKKRISPSVVALRASTVAYDVRVVCEKRRATLFSLSSCNMLDWTRYLHNCGLSLFACVVTHTLEEDTYPWNYTWYLSVLASTRVLLCVMHEPMDTPNIHMHSFLGTCLLVETQAWRISTFCSRWPLAIPYSMWKKWCPLKRYGCLPFRTYGFPFGCRRLDIVGLFNVLWCRDAVVMFCCPSLHQLDVRLHPAYLCIYFAPALLLAIHSLWRRVQ